MPWADPSVQPNRLAPARPGAALAARLRARRGEIEQAALARVYAISDPAAVEDPAYVAGLREAVAAALDYGLAAIDAPAARGQVPAPVPVELLAQARYAAQAGVSLDTVLRRYFAGYTLLGDFIVQAAEEAAAPASELQRALRGGATLFDRLVSSVSEEYIREDRGHSRTTVERRAAQVRMLLGGELVDASDLGYELDAWHIGLIAIGSGAGVAIRDFAGTLDRRLLAVCARDDTVWAWLGGRARLTSREVLCQAESTWSGEEVLAIGEPGHGIEGWRLSHRQARAALPVAIRESPGAISYSDVALVASALQDEVLVASLRESYLVPFESERDGGQALRETLQAYLSAGRNVSSAAAALGVSRQTVTNRLGLAEELYDCPLDSRATEIETALRLHDVVGSGEVAILQHT